MRPNFFRKVGNLFVKTDEKMVISSGCSVKHVCSYKFKCAFSVENINEICATEN